MSNVNMPVARQLRTRRSFGQQVPSIPAQIGEAEILSASVVGFMGPLNGIPALSGGVMVLPGERPTAEAVPTPTPTASVRCGGKFPTDSITLA
jgi:hypothetical protein